MHRKNPWAKRVRKERFRKRYLTRMQASRHLQVDSMQFRRLCILKGIYPRAIGRSKQKASGNEKQYYLAKEVKWLVQDEVGKQCFAYKAWEKKVRRAKAMRQREELKNLLENKKPGYSLAATLKERYPYFADALKDVDDAMTNIALYAFLSPEIQSDTTIEFHHALPSGLHEKAKAIVNQWFDFVARSGALTKAFISIKGYYFEALVRGQRVVWLMPHEFAHKFPSGIQQYVLITFLEFYVELMRFVLFKLESDLRKAEEEKNRIEDEGKDPNTADFDADAAAAGGKAAQLQSKAAAEKSEQQTVQQLFSNFVFYLSREVPKRNLKLVIDSCGGRVVDEFGPTVTHYIVDRPSLLPPHTPQPTVEYVQPQYVFDCLNAHFLLPVKGYRMGEELPPHVSPFTVSIANTPADLAAIEETKKRHPKVLGYVPERVHQIRKLKDPTYNPQDPEKLLGDDDDSEASDVERRTGVRKIMDDEVELDASEVAVARQRVPWAEETVTELPERSKLSALQVKKQRELNLLNRPTSEAAAARRAAALREADSKTSQESATDRLKRKLAAKAKEERAQRKMKLQVARKKAARYFKMVNSAVEGAKRREAALEKKAEALKRGKAGVSKDGTTFAQLKRAREESANSALPQPKKARREDGEATSSTGAASGDAARRKANPYRALPKWVR